MEHTADPDRVVRLSEPRGRWVLLATVLGSSVAMLDATVVNVALPTLGDDLGASLAGLQWTINAYTLTLAALILLGGSLSDRYGRRRIFVVGVVWFALASALCALATDVTVLVAARALQGIGGALLTPGSLAIISASFHPDDRSRAIGAWSGLGGVAGAAGPFVGGWLIAGPGWRWVFLLNLPLAAVVVAVTLRHVPESRDASARGPFDVTGALTGALGLAGITYALIRAGETGFGDGAVLTTGLLGILAMAGFVVVERRGRNPMVPTGIFASRQFTATNGVTFAVYAALGGVFFLLVLHLQVVAGFSPLASGTALLPVTVLMLLLSARVGAWAQRIGPRLPMTAGPAVSAVGLVLLTRVGPDASYGLDVLPAVAVFGLGLSFTVAPLTATVLGAADPRHAGMASGVNNAVARAAGLLAVAVIPLVVGLDGADYRDAALFATGFRRAMWLCAALLTVGAVLAWSTIRDDVLVQPTVTPEPGEPVAAAPREQLAAHGVRTTASRDDGHPPYHCGVGAPPLDPGPLPATAPGEGSSR